MTADPTTLIARVRELDREATPGPWKAFPGATTVGRTRYPHITIAAADSEHKEDRNVAHLGYGYENRDSDARLIAEYRTLAVQLADALEKAERELSDRTAQLEAANDETARWIERTANHKRVLARTEQQLTASRERERRLREALRGIVEHDSGCVTEPPCGRCGYCDAVAALAAADGETGALAPPAAEEE